MNKVIILVSLLLYPLAATAGGGKCNANATAKAVKGSAGTCDCKSRANCPSTDAYFIVECECTCDMDPVPKYGSPTGKGILTATSFTENKKCIFEGALGPCKDPQTPARSAFDSACARKYPKGSSVMGCY